MRRRFKRALMSAALFILALSPLRADAAAFHSQHGPAINWWYRGITAAARAEHISPYMLAGLIWVESRGQAHVISSAGAIGLTQLEPVTAASMGVNPYIPRQNILGGARYLRYLLDHFAGGNITTALAMYNGGPGNPQYGYAAAVEAQSY
jgi:soluble lytic murein transglycosylase-like protein